MIRRRRKCLLIDSSDEDYCQKLELSNTKISKSVTSCNKKKRRKVPRISSEESSASERDEIVHPSRSGSLRALSDYDSCNSEEENLIPQIVKKKRYVNENTLVPHIFNKESSASESDEIVHPSRSGSLRALSDYDSCNSEEENLTPEIVKKKRSVNENKSVPHIFNKESSASESEEIIHPSRSGSLRALSDYDSCTSEEENLTHIVKKKRFLNGNISAPHISSEGSVASESEGIVHPSRLRSWISSDYDSSNSEEENVISQIVKKKRSVNGNISVPRISIEESSTSTSKEIIHPSSCGSWRVTSNYDSCNGGEENVTPQIVKKMSVNGNISDSSSSSDVQTRSGKRVFRIDSPTDNKVPNGVKRLKVSLDEKSSSSSSLSNSVTNTSNSSTTTFVESEDDEIIVHRRKPPRQPSQRILDTSSSSESEDEIPIRRPKNQRAKKAIIESDDDNKSQSPNMSESDDTSEVCPICLNKFDLQQVGQPSACDHCFCLPCIEEWSKNNNTCPVDRQRFGSIKVLSSIHGAIIKEIPVFNTQRMLSSWGIQVFSLEVDFENPQILYYSSDEQDDDYINERCCVCSSTEEDGNMIYCDVCYDVYHLRCTDPRIHAFPVGPWICSNCLDII